MKLFFNYKLHYLLFIIINCVIVSLYFTYSRDKVVYVNKDELYNNFKMTKISLKNLENENKIRLQKLDSLNFLFINATNQQERLRYYEYVENIKVENQNFLDRELSNLEEKIENRINSYLKEYCQENNIDFLLTDGTIVGDSNDDMTKNALIYINEKYNGL